VNRRANTGIIGDYLVLALVAAGSSACANLAHALTGEPSEEDCAKSLKSMTPVPPEPPAVDISGTWSCAAEGNRSLLHIVANGSKATITVDVPSEMTDQGSLIAASSYVVDGEVGGHTLVWKDIVANNVLGGVTRLEVDASGRVLDGSDRSVERCGPRRKTCTRRR